MRRTTIAIIAALITTTAMAEPRIVWRSSTTGTIPTPATVPPSQPPSPIDNPDAISIEYEANGRTFGIGRPMTLAPAISGGSGRYEFAFAAGNTFPVGIVFNSATGIFSGSPQERGDFSFNLLVRDKESGQYVTAVVRFLVV
ncbi:hypothetical protein LPJGGPFB_06580 [Ensifer adhaerens]|uniref:putative Ig domain-containing protein n=1 Tax=Ensifer adhaerens TaxID=106592 RepID=UPI00156960F5|nr:putative Ig domain-containing protein [Ensifer adhaerens]NRP23310.1 hypothetical protein [Ensifer adhaerens]